VYGWCRTENPHKNTAIRNFFIALQKYNKTIDMKTRELLKIVCIAGLMTAAWTSSSAATVMETATLRTENITENTVKVKGVVLDYETKQPISGAVFLLKGNPTKNRTNSQGEFQLEVPSGTTVKVAFNQEYTTEDITLTADAENLTVELKKIVMPEFPGGPAECMKFLAQNIRYPKKARENGIQGRVVVQFVVDKDGSIDDIKIVNSVSWELNDEAKRVIKKMPKFKPGTIGGEPARMQSFLPVMFRLK
jgi:TonB family protein